MDQKHIRTLVILVFCQRMTSGADPTTVTEGESYDIYCKPAEIGSMVIWFRLLDKSGMEFIGSFSNVGIRKSPEQLQPNFSDSKMNDNKLTLKSFNKVNDSGVYSCASLKSNELKFGEARHLVGVSAAVTAAAAPQDTAIQPCPSTTSRPCTCYNNNNRQDIPFLYCTPIILGPLAGACGLLLLLLIITTLYCNKIRTRRCPHHYKRRPRTMAPGKQMMTNRHV